MKAIVYDCEIIKAIPDRNNPPIDGIEYCKGWGDHAGMGVSVIGAYDYATSRYRVFCNDNFQEFERLFAAADLAVGFNNIGFDDKLLAASGIITAAESPPRYDLMRETMAAAGSASFAGFGLGPICEATFLEGKTGNGALAPVQWQLGQIGAVIDYCLMDVRLTVNLFNRALSGADVINPKDGQRLKLRSPYA